MPELIIGILFGLIIIEFVLFICLIFKMKV